MKKNTLLKEKASKYVVFFIYFCLPFLSPAQGEWQWAKSYSGFDGIGNTANNEILCSDFDSEGNIYIFGKFGGNATIDGEGIFPNTLITLMGASYEPDRAGIVLAKFSPQGTLMWKKMIRCGNEDVHPLWMEIKNDEISFLGTTHFGYPFYYLDTLVTTAGQLPFINQYLNCFVTLDLDGNVIKEHFFRMHNRESSSFILSSIYLTIHKAPFQIDQDGNIYLMARVNHYGGDVNDPVTIVVDEEKSFDFYTNRACAGEYTLQDWFLFKFSPDWDLLWYKQLVDHATGINLEVTPGNPNGYIVSVNRMTADEDGSLYIYGDLRLTILDNEGTIHNYPVKIYWDDVHYTVLPSGYATFNQSFMCKYDPSGNVLWSKQLYPSQSNNTPGTYTSFYDIIVNGNRVYFFGYALNAYSNNSEDNIFINKELSIPVKREEGQESRSFIIIFDNQSGEYIDHGYVPASDRTRMEGKAAIINNHIIFANRIGLASQENLISYFRDDGILMQVDTIEEMNSSLKRTHGNIRVHESGKLFFDIQTTSTISFGNFNISSNGSNSMGVFALKDDPSLLIPYEYDSTHIVSYPQQNVFYLYPNPAQSEINIKFENEYSHFQKAEIFNLNGQKLGEYSSLSISVASLPAGMYLLKIYVDHNIHVQKFIKTNH